MHFDYKDITVELHTGEEFNYVYVCGTGKKKIRT
jgi:hypothetical protein